MRTRIEGRDGWVEIVRDGVSLLAKGDADLRARLESALDAAVGDDLADVVTDELTTGGVRRAPDFAILDEVGARVLVRGDARVLITDGEGRTREVRAPARGPWVDEDLGRDTDQALLTGGAPRVPEHEGPPTLPDPTAPDAAAPEPAIPGPTGGWALPSVFGTKDAAVPGLGEASGSGEPATARRPGLKAVPSESSPIAQATVIETPAPAGRELVEDLPDAADGGGDTGRGDPDRSDPDREKSGSAAEQELPIDAGPVAAAEEEPAVGGQSGTLPPMPGSTSLVETPHEVAVEAPSKASIEAGEELRESPAAAEVIPPAGPARASAARDDSSGHEPGGTSPQFFNGHLVGSRVPGAAKTDDDVGARGASAARGADGMISSVPGGDGASAPAGSAPEGASAPAVPTDAPSQPTGEPQGAGAAEVAAGPMVLAVRCSSGHHNAPHATRCRVCGQDLPTQQPEQTPRPALGVLRLSTGEVVTLDRGVLIGRAPRAGAEAGGAHVPHLVRISSPDNEISRNHVEIVLDGWHVLVRDLGSTNGTTIALPGSSPVRVRPGDQQTIEPGATITLAGQVSMVFEVTG